MKLTNNAIETNCMDCLYLPSCEIMHSLPSEELCKYKGKIHPDCPLQDVEVIEPNSTNTFGDTFSQLIRKLDVSQIIIVKKKGIK